MQPSPPCADRIAVVGGGSSKPEWVHLVDCLHHTRRDPCGLLVVRVPQEVEDDLAVHCMDPRPMGAVLHWE